MTTTDSAKPIGTKTPNKSGSTASKPTSNTRTARNSNGTARANNGGGRRPKSRETTAPISTTTVASLVGVGVAIGFGLFATRSRWMRYAQDLNDYLHDRLDQFSDQVAEAEDDHAELVSKIDDSLNTKPELVSASFPAEHLHSNA